MTKHSEDVDFSVSGSPFPDENVHPDRKAHPKYGLQYGKAIHYASNRFGYNGTWNDEQFDTLMEVAQGNLSISRLQKMFGYYLDQGESGDIEKNAIANLSYIDIKVLNLATKYINRAVEKMVNNHYNLNVQAIDPVSVRKKKAYEDNVKAYYEYKDWMAKMGVDPKEFFPDLDIEVLPEFPDDLFFEMITNEKTKEAIQAEMGLQLIHEINDFSQTRRMVDRYLVCIGRGHVHCYRDGNGIPREDMINPKYFVGSYSEREDYKGQEYAGFYDFPTVGQFRKEAAGWIPDEEIENIISHFANQNKVRNEYHPSHEEENYDGLNYIPVLRFYFLSEDKRAYVKIKTDAGNERLLEKAIVKGAKKASKLKPEEEASAIKNEYTSVYGGTWVLDTDWVYQYEQKSVGRSNLVDAELPIISHAPNMYQGRVVSFLAQMIEPLYMINMAWNKIKEILAKGWMGIQEIDFSEFENIAMGAGGKKWTPRQVYRHFLQTARLIKRSNINKHDQRYSAGAINTDPTGISLADYINVFSTSINLLEGMIGTAAAEQMDKPDRLAVRVAQMSQNVGDLDMGYLYNADQSMFRRVSHQMLLLMQEAKRDGVGIEGFIQALGQHFAVPEDIAYCDFGFQLVPAPTVEEWADFYDDLKLGLQSGTLTHLDVAYIREIKNLKKARQILGMRVKVNERKAKQNAEMNNQMAMQANAASAQSKFEADRQIELLKDELERRRMNDQAVIDDALIARKAQADAEIMRNSDKAKERISKQKSIDSMIQQGMKNKTTKEVERQKASMKSKEKAEK